MQHKCNGKLIGTLGINDLFSKVTTPEMNAFSQDVVFVSPVGNRAAIEGGVYLLALYTREEGIGITNWCPWPEGLRSKLALSLQKLNAANQGLLRINAEADCTGQKGQTIHVLPGDRLTTSSIADNTRQYMKSVEQRRA